jgi:hypothetical protein
MFFFYYFRRIKYIDEDLLPRSIVDRMKKYAIESKNAKSEEFRVSLNIVQIDSKLFK